MLETARFGGQSGLFLYCALMLLQVLIVSSVLASLGWFSSWNHSYCGAEQWRCHYDCRYNCRSHDNN